MADEDTREPGRRAPTIGLGVWALAVLIVTLSPVEIPPNAERLGFWCLACGDRGVADAVLNWVAFLPGGILLGRLLGGRRAVWVAVLGSVGLEMLQVTIPGRYPSLSDIVFNGSGALVGVLLTRPRFLRRARVVGAAAAVVAWLSPLVLLVPVAPGEVVYGQWTPVIGGMGRFEGGVLEARVGGLPLPSWRVEDPEVTRALRDPMRLDLHVRTGPTPEGIAPVFSVADLRGFRLLIVAAEDMDVAVHRRALASTLRLEQPLVWFEGALAGVEMGGPATLVLTREAGATCIEAPGARGCAAAPGLERGWQFFFGSFWRPGPASVALSGLWCLVLGGLAGVGAGSAGRGFAAGLALGMVGYLLAVSYGPQAGMGPAWIGFLVAGATTGGLLAAPLGRWTGALAPAGEACGRGGQA